MKQEYDFSKGKRGPILRSRGKTRVTMYLDNEVIEAFRAKGDEVGRSLDRGEGGRRCSGEVGLERHDAAQIGVEQRDGEGRVAVGGTVDHALDDELCPRRRHRPHRTTEGHGDFA